MVESSRDPRLAHRRESIHTPRLEHTRSEISSPTKSSEDQIEITMGKSNQLLQELSRFGTAISSTANTAVRADLSKEEADSQQWADRKFGKHKLVFLPLSESGNAIVGDSERSQERFRQQRSQTEKNQKEATLSLVSKIQSAPVPSKESDQVRDGESQEEIVSLRRNLKQTQRSLDELQEDTKHLKRNALYQRDLDDAPFITKDQLWSYVKKELVGIESKLATLTVQVDKSTSSKNSQSSAKVTTLTSSVDEVKTQLVDIRSQMNDIGNKVNNSSNQLLDIDSKIQKRPTIEEQALIQTRLDQLTAKVQPLENNLNALGATTTTQNETARKINAAVFGHTGESGGLTSIATSLSNEIDHLKGQLLSLRTTPKDIASQSSGLDSAKVETLIDDSVKEVRREQKDFETTLLEEIDRIHTTTNQLQEEIMHFKSQSTQGRTAGRPPTPPQTHNSPASVTHTLSRDPGMDGLSNKVRSLEAVVTFQQQKFESLSTTQVRSG